MLVINKFYFYSIKIKIFFGLSALLLLGLTCCAYFSALFACLACLAGCAGFPASIYLIFLHTTVFFSLSTFIFFLYFSSINSGKSGLNYLRCIYMALSSPSSSLPSSSTTLQLWFFWALGLVLVYIHYLILFYIFQFSLPISFFFSKLTRKL